MLPDTVATWFRETDIAASLGLIKPELILLLTVLAVLVRDMFLPVENSRKSGIVALIGTLTALMYAMSADLGVAFGGSFAVDGISAFFRVLFLIAALIVIVVSMLSNEVDRYRQGEYYAIILGATISMTFLVGSGNAIMFFLALETLSLSSYILVGYSKGTRAAAEASLKYLLYGSMVSGVLLFGLSYLYGLSGSLSFPEMLVRPFEGHYTMVAAIGLLMVLAGLFFKTSIVPFHIWTPDIYQGAPAPISGFLSTASKAAGFGAILRIVAPIAGLDALGEFRKFDWWGLVHIDLRFVFWILAAASMTLGNFAALRQRSLKRLLAYSSIAHAGYMLMVFTSVSAMSKGALMTYLVVYLFMNLGFFLAVVLMENEAGTDDMEAFGGWGRRYPVLGICFTTILVSLIGLPPTAGFSAKFQLFAAVLRGPDGGIDTWQILLVLIAVLNSVVSLAYYIRPAKILFFDKLKEPPADAPVRGPWTRGQAALVTAALLVLTLPLLALFLDWQSIVGAANLAVLAIGH